LLRTISGVGSVSVIDGQKREVQVLIDPDRLKAYNLSIKTIATALEKQNVEFPGGRMTQEEGETVIRTLGRVKSVQEFSSIVVSTDKGTPITIANIGRVADGVVEPRTLSRYDGRNAVSLIIRKQSGTNTVSAVDAVRERLTDIRKLLPAAVSAEITRDQSEFHSRVIPQSAEVHVVRCIVCQHHRLLFPGQSAVDPDCRRGDCFHVHVAGCSKVFTQSHYTLGTNTRGRYRHRRRYRRAGEYLPPHRRKKHECIRGSTSRNSGGRSRGQRNDIVSRRYLCSGRIPQGNYRYLAEHRRSSRESRFYSLIDRGYTAMLRWSLCHHWVIICLVIGVFAATLLIAKQVRISMMANDDRGEFEINIKTLPGYSLAQTDAVTRKIEDEIRPRSLASLTCYHWWEVQWGKA
jgi:multidrug efflux pump subunit AcrB